MVNAGVDSRFYIRHHWRLTPVSRLFIYRQGLLRRLDTAALHADGTQTAHIFSGHQRYSGILVPTMNRVLTIEAGGALVDKPPLLDVEIFEAQFK